MKWNPNAQPVILASKSQARQNLLHQAHVKFQICTADIDERALERAHLHLTHQDCAYMLAKSKVEAVAKQFDGYQILGADQILVVENERLHQCKNRAEAKLQLKKLSGKTHALISSAVLLDSEKIYHHWTETAIMHMRHLTDDEIETYLKNEGPAVIKSVGCYFFEGMGKDLFHHVEGSFDTILGLPFEGLLQYWVKKGDLIP